LLSKINKVVTVYYKIHAEFKSKY